MDGIRLSPMEQNTRPGVTVRGTRWDSSNNPRWTRVSERSPGVVAGKVTMASPVSAAKARAATPDRSSENRHEDRGRGLASRLPLFWLMRAGGQWRSERTGKSESRVLIPAWHGPHFHTPVSGASLVAVRFAFARSARRANLTTPAAGTDPARCHLAGGTPSRRDFRKVSYDPH